MINDPKMIDELIKKLEQVPKEIIQDAVREVIKEDKNENIREVLKNIENNDYNNKENYYYEEKYNIYLHSTSTNWLKRKLEKNKNIELEVA